MVVLFHLCRIVFRLTPNTKYQICIKASKLSKLDARTGHWPVKKVTPFFALYS